MRPILKWAGGKRQLLSEIVPLIRSMIPRGATYAEPFLGGGAVLFELLPSKAIVNDLNAELINVCVTVRDRLDELIDALKRHALDHSQTHYYETRALDRSSEYASMSEVERAARTIYLNRTCYNGLYRVNASGQFNVPFGRYKNPSIVNAEALRAVSEYLRDNDVTICCGDYRSVVERLEENSFVYFDPPYQPLSRSSSFVGYTECGFDYERQIELRDVCVGLRARNIPFVESNSDCEAIRELYSDFEIETVRARRSVNSAVGGRGAINEVLIYCRRRGGD